MIYNADINEINQWRVDEDGWSVSPTGDRIRVGRGVSFGNNVWIGDRVEIGNSVRIGNGDWCGDVY